MWARAYIFCLVLCYENMKHKSLKKQVPSLVYNFDKIYWILSYLLQQLLCLPLLRIQLQPIKCLYTMELLIMHHCLSLFFDGKKEWGLQIEIRIKMNSVLNVNRDVYTRCSLLLTQLSLHLLQIAISKGSLGPSSSLERQLFWTWRVGRWSRGKNLHYHQYPKMAVNRQVRLTRLMKFLLQFF